MVNLQTVLSVYDDKVTLMQWLKKVEKALKDSTLVSIETKQVEANKASFVFVFEDGTRVETPSITIPKGYGTKLYKHSFKGFTPGGDERRIEVISLSQVPVSLNKENVKTLLESSLSYLVKNETNTLLFSDKDVLEITIRNDWLSFSSFVVSTISIGADEYNLLEYATKSNIEYFEGEDTVIEL